MPNARKRYTPLPTVPPEAAQRLAMIVEVLAGLRTVSEAARSLGLSRNHFQTLMHRGVAGLAEGISPKPAGRPGKTEAQAKLEAEVAQLRRENARLQARVGSTDRLLEAATGVLKGRIRTMARKPRARTAKDKPREDGDDSDPDRCRVLAGVEAMRRLGLSADLAAVVAGVHAATARRWRARSRRQEPLARRAVPRHPGVPPQAAEHARHLVRSLHGLVGAESLRRSVGVSRRQAARIKADTLTQMERERKAALTRVRVSVPGILRGMDAMVLGCADGAAVRAFLRRLRGAVPDQRHHRQPL
jgi:hypothetical protein